MFCQQQPVDWLNWNATCAEGDLRMFANFVAEQDTVGQDIVHSMHNDLTCANKSKQKIELNSVGTNSFVLAF